MNWIIKYGHAVMVWACVALVVGLWVGVFCHLGSMPAEPTYDQLQQRIRVLERQLQEQQSIVKNKESGQ